MTRGGHRLPLNIFDTSVTLFGLLDGFALKTPLTYFGSIAGGTRKRPFYIKTNAQVVIRDVFGTLSDVKSCRIAEKTAEEVKRSPAPRLRVKYDFCLGDVRWEIMTEDY